MVDEIKSKRVEFVDIVDGNDKPIAGFEHPVPSHWIGTDLLPEGAKKAPKGLESEADTSGNDAKVAELEAKVAELEKQLEAAKAPKPAGRSGS